MNKLRNINSVCGTKLYADVNNPEFILLKDWMLKPLWLQFALGIEEPMHKLPGVVSTFATEPQVIKPIRVTINDGGYEIIYLTAEEINEPGFEYQLRIIKGFSYGTTGRIP